MSDPILLTGARVVDPAADHDAIADVMVEDGLVVEVGAADDRPGVETVDCSGLVVAPGLVDLHTHLREPGSEHKETIETGTRAAAAGGYTAVAAMANTDPVADHAAVIHQVRDLAVRAGLCDVFPIGAITQGLAGELLAEMGEMVEAGVRLFSDDGRCVPSARVLRNALVYARAFDGVTIAEHCDDASMSEGGQMHEGLPLVVARTPRPARGGGGGHRGTGPGDRTGDRRPDPPVSPLQRPLGRPRPPGEDGRGPGHGRGYARTTWCSRTKTFAPTTRTSR